MKYLLAFLLTLFITPTILQAGEGFQKGHLVSPRVLCITEKSILELAESDAESEGKNLSIFLRLQTENMCKPFPANFLVGVIEEVVMDYVDYSGQESQILKIKLLRPESDKKLYTIAFTASAEGASYYKAPGNDI